MAYEKIVLIVVMGTSFVTPFMGSAMNIAIPAIGQEFHSNAIDLSWIVSSYILATVACLLPVGRFADLRGRSRIYFTGISIFSVATLGCAMADNLAWLIGCRVLQGMGASCIFSTGIAILAAVFPPERRGQALGFSTASTYVGLSAGPVLGGLISFYLGWRSIFWISALLGFVMFLLAYRYLRREQGSAAGESFDRVGCFLYMSGLVASLQGFAFLTGGAGPALLLCVGLILLAGFAAYERRQEYPLLEVRLFTENLTFAFSNLAAMINYCATFAVGFLASLYLQVVLDLDARSAGLVMLSQPLLMAVFSPFAGHLSDRMEPRIVASGGMALTALGLLLFAFVDADTSLSWVIADLSLMGLGFAFFSSPNNNAIMGAVGREKYGVAASALSTMRMAGQAVSISTVALIMSWHGGQSAMGQSAPMVLQSMRSALGLFTVLSMLGIVFSLKRGRVR